jgi:hypothetical protein
MLQLQSPIGSLIFHSYSNPASIGDDSLLEKIDNLSDIIQNRTLHKGIEYTSRSLHNELFEIRVHFLNLLVSKPELLEELSNRILDEISDKYFLRNDHYGLGLIMSDAWEIYYKIFSGISNNRSFLEAIAEFPLRDIPKWSGLKILLKQYPAEMHPPHLVAFMESSLDFDYALLLSEFIFRDILQVGAEIVNDLKIFLKESLIHFAAYCVLTGYWQPETADEHPFVRNIKIKAAALRLDNGQGVLYSTENLHQLLNS